MTIREVSRKLRAWKAGRPLPRYDTLHHAVMPNEQVLVVAFVRMGGESRPWGIAWGHPGESPTVRTVPDGRVRDDVGVLCAEFAEDLLDHMRVHNWTFDPVEQKPAPADLRQLWVPNGAHVAMLHQLSYTYSQTRFGGDNQEVLRALGRLAGWMFRDSFRRGNQHVVNASEALREAYVFPTQDARTAHLGYQLAWMHTAGDRDARMVAAMEAERQSVSATLEPSIERDELQDLVDSYQEELRGNGDPDQPAAAIRELLEPELERRWHLAEEAYDDLALNARSANRGVDALVMKAHDEFWFQHQRIELRLADPSHGPAFVAHPETDFHGSAAGSRYLVHASADEAYIGHLIHDDRELLAEAFDEGKAVRGVVTAVTDVGQGRATRPQWVLEVDRNVPHRLRENGKLAPHGSRGHEATILALDVTTDALEVRLEWTDRKTKPLSCGIAVKPVDSTWMGQEVAFVVADAADLTWRRSTRVWKAKDGPGAWLTHGRAGAPLAVAAEDDSATTDLVVDDIAQIEEGADA